MPAVRRSAKPTGYQAMIQVATGAPDKLLPALERIMRRDVFHSTLDWQSAAEFNLGARQALALYRRDAAFYDAETSQLVLTCNDKRYMPNRMHGTNSFADKVW